MLFCGEFDSNQVCLKFLNFTEERQEVPTVFVKNFKWTDKKKQRSAVMSRVWNRSSCNLLKIDKPYRAQNYSSLLSQISSIKNKNQKPEILTYTLSLNKSEFKNVVWVCEPMRIQTNDVIIVAENPSQFIVPFRLRHAKYIKYSHDIRSIHRDQAPPFF